MKRKLLLIILFVFVLIVLGSILIYNNNDKNKEISNISEDLEQSSDGKFRVYINKIKTLYKGSDRKDVIKILGNPDTSGTNDTISMYQLTNDSYAFDDAIVLIRYQNNKLESASWLPKDDKEFVPIELK